MMTEAEVLEKLAFFKNAIIGLKKKLDDKEDAINALNANVSGMSAEISHLVEENQNANEKYEDLKHKTYLTIKHLVEDNIEQKEAYIKSLEEDRDHWKLEKEKADATIESLKSSEEVESLKKELSDKKKELFDKNLALLRSQAAEADALSAFSGLQKDYEAMKVEYESMKKRGNIQDSINKQNKIKEDNKQKIVLKPVIKMPVGGWQDLQFAEVACDYKVPENDFGIVNVKSIKDEWVHSAFKLINSKWYCATAEGYSPEYSRLAAKLLSKTYVTIKDEAGLKSTKPVIQVEGEHVISNFSPTDICNIIKRCVEASNDN